MPGCATVTLKLEQRATAKSTYEGKDLFLRLPTGFGKKLCYNVLPFVFVVKLGRLTDNSTNRPDTSKLNWTLQCRSIVIVNIPRGRRHCTHPLIVTTSLDTHPLKSTWTSCTNYAHARTVDTRRTFPYLMRLGTRLTQGDLQRWLE